MVVDIAVLDGVVDAGDGDGLRRAPVGRREREAGRGRGTLRRVVARERDRDVRRGLARELHREGRGGSRLAGDETGRGAHVDAHGVIVGVRGADVGGVVAGVARIRARPRADHDGIVDARDRHGLRHAPARGRERQARGCRGSFCGIARGDGDHDVRGGLAREHDRERRGSARFARDQPRRGRRRGARHVVIGVRDAHVGGVVARVAGVCARDCARDDRVGLIAVDREIVDARHGDGLGNVPIRRGEGQARRGRGALGRSAAREREARVGGRLARQPGGERGGPSRLGGDEARDRGQRHADSVVVRVRDRHVGGIQAGIVNVAAGGGAGRHGVGLVAVGDGVVDARHRDRLRHIPVRTGERQAGRGDRALCGIRAGERERDVGVRLRIEPDREHRGPAALGGDEAGRRRHPDAGDVVVGVHHADVGAVASRVVRIRAHRRLDLDHVGLVTVDLEVVHAVDRHGMRQVPVRGRENQTRRRRRALAGLRAHERDCHRRCGLRLEYDRRQRTVARLARHQPGGRAHDDGRSIGGDERVGELRGVGEVERRGGDADRLADRHVCGDRRVERRAARAVRGHIGRAQVALALAVPAGVAGGAREVFDPVRRIGLTRERALHAQRRPARADQRQHGEVLQIVRASVRIERVVRRDAVVSEVDPERAIRADRVPEDHVPVARGRVECHAGAAVVRDQVALARVHAADGEVRAPKGAGDEQPLARVPERERAARVHADRVPDEAIRESRQADAHARVARDDVPLAGGGAADREVVAVRLEARARRDQRPVRDRRAAGRVRTHVVTAERAAGHGGLHPDAVRAVPRDDVPRLRRGAAHDDAVRPHLEPVSVVCERGRAGRVDPDPVAGHDAARAGDYDAAAAETAERQAADLAARGEDLDPVAAGAGRAAVHGHDRGADPARLALGVEHQRFRELGERGGERDPRDAAREVVERGAEPGRARAVRDHEQRVLGARREPGLEEARVREAVGIDEELAERSGAGRIRVDDQVEVVPEIHADDDRIVVRGPLDRRGRLGVAGRTGDELVRADVDPCPRPARQPVHPAARAGARRRRL